MSRALLVLLTDDIRQRAVRWILKAPPGTRVEFKRKKRTLPQNERFWAMLTDVADQREHGGRKYTADAWKIIFMAAIGCEVQFIPSLDGKGVVPWGQSSADLSKEEMSDLIDFIACWGAQNGVIFQDEKRVAA